MRGYFASTSAGAADTDSVTGTAADSNVQILNLGCGTRTSPYCLNVDWSIYLRMRSSRAGAWLARVWLRGDRRQRFESLDPNIVVHDLRKGIPAADGTAAAVYHSHLLEHLDRDAVPGFFKEVLRVLAPGGVHRVVVPDLETISSRYLNHLAGIDAGVAASEDHDQYVADLVEQMVRHEAHGTSQQPQAKRMVENLLLRDARHRGEVHRWMYDRVNLAALLQESGFHSIRLVDRHTSAIPIWDKIRMDEDERGDEYKPGSLYMEARR